MENEKLIFKKKTFNNESYAKTLKVSNALHDAVIKICNETGLPVSEVSCTLVEFALKHVVIEK